MLLRAPEDVEPDEPVWIRFAAFIDERFEFAGHFFLAAAFYTASQAVARTLEATGPFPFDLDWLLALGVVFLGMYHYRVFDEHKDYEEDLEYNPQRVVQRGVFTLDELKVTAGVAIALELVFAWAISWPALSVSVIGIAVSFLLLEEFFLSEWLQQNFVAYGLSHLLGWVPMPFLGYSVATGRYPWEASAWFWLYVAGVFAVVASWEFSRKMRVPGQDPRREDAYTEHFGVVGAAWVVLAVQLFGALAAGAVGWRLGQEWWFVGAPLAVYAVCSIGTIRYLRDPVPERAVALRNWGEGYLVGFHAAVAVAFVLHSGATSLLTG